MNENQDPLAPDDPRVTAYALGELAGDEGAAVEAAVRRDPALQAIVSDIRALEGDLVAALADGPAPSVSRPLSASTSPSGSLRQSASPSPFDARRGTRLLRFPGLYYVMAGAAAAGFAVLVAVREPVVPIAKDIVTRFTMTFPDVPSPAPSTGERGVENSRGFPRRDFVRAAESPSSRFPLVVGTAAYREVREYLRSGRTPPAEAVRIEEMVNYFPYDYEPPAAGTSGGESPPPLSAHLEVASAPWAPTHRLVRIGLMGREVASSLPGVAPMIAQNVSLEVEFNPARASEYRLIGYESRAPSTEETTREAVVAGEIRSGHRVTALYEVVPVEGSGVTGPLDRKEREAMLTLTIRYREPDGGGSHRLKFSLIDAGADFEVASPDFQFAAAVAGFGMVLRESPHRGTASFPAVTRWAERGATRDPGGRRADFLDLVRRAETMVR